MSDNINYEDDPRLTAYALGELEGDELSEVAALVAGNEDARRVVDAIRGTAKAVDTGWPSTYATYPYNGACHRDSPETAPRTHSDETS